MIHIVGNILVGCFLAFKKGEAALLLQGVINSTAGVWTWILFSYPALISNVDDQFKAKGLY
ncbi:hypothetical protein GQ44DRAFT_698680, partial [Phaeosphaeriaceae sp. PMI808]